MGLLPGIRKKKKNRAGAAEQTAALPLPKLADIARNIKGVPAVIDIMRQRFNEREETGYAVAHSHLRRLNMFDARMRFKQTLNRNPEREDARFFLAVAQALSGRKHEKEGLAALRDPAGAGFPGFAEEAAYYADALSGGDIGFVRPPFTVMARTEQYFREFPDDMRMRALKEEGAPLTALPEGAEAEYSGIAPQSPFIYDDSILERECAAQLVNLFSEYVPEKTGVRALCFGDRWGHAYAYLREKNMAPDACRAVLPSPAPRIIGEEVFTERKGGTEITGFDDPAPAREGTFEAVIAPYQAGYYADPAAFFADIAAWLSPGALLAFAVPLLPEDDAEARFFPHLHMFAYGEEYVRACMEKAGAEYIKCRRFTRYSCDMRRLLCVYRMKP